MAVPRATKIIIFQGICPNIVCSGVMTSEIPLANTEPKAPIIRQYAILMTMELVLIILRIIDFMLPTMTVVPRAPITIPGIPKYLAAIAPTMAPNVTSAPRDISIFPEIMPKLMPHPRMTDSRD